MLQARFYGWNPGLNKVEMDKLLHRETRLGLAESKRCVDRMLRGESVIVHFPSAQSAQHVVAAATALGALCELWSEIDDVQK